MTTRKKSSNTAKKLQPKKKVPGIPFKSGFDARRNLHGRPKAFDELRKLFQEIAEDEITVDGKKMTRAQAIGIMMTTQPDKFKDFLEYAYGKVPLPQIIKVDDSKSISWKEFINGNGTDSDSGS
jgi:hypothetical protein